MQVITPLKLTAPDKISSPFSTSLGSLSPVKLEVSSDVSPFIILQSTDTTSPTFTKILSPFFSFFAFITYSFPSFIILAVLT